MGVWWVAGNSRRWLSSTENKDEKLVECSQEWVRADLVLCAEFEIHSKNSSFLKELNNGGYEHTRFIMKQRLEPAELSAFTTSKNNAFVKKIRK